jgi:uncharacterized protein with PIN domain
MTRMRAQLEAKLREAADEVIDSYLAWDDENSCPTLTEIEDVILELRRRMGQVLLETALASQETRQPAERPKCPSCGEEMRYKGRKEKAIESRVGGLAIERGYYYCACCQSGFFPPGPTTGVRERAVE